MLRTLTCILVAWTCLLLGACSSVTTTHLIGEPIDEEQGARFEGAWTGGESLFLAHYLGDGKLQIATTKWNESEKKFKIDQEILFIRKVGEAMFLQIPEDREGGANAPARYSLARLLLTENGEMIYLAADARQFGKAVDAGALTGEAKGLHGESTVEGFASDSQDVHLTGTKEQIDAYLTPEHVAVLFTLDEGGVLRRLDRVDIK